MARCWRRARFSTKLITMQSSVSGTRRRERGSPVAQGLDRPQAALVRRRGRIVARRLPSRRVTVIGFFRPSSRDVRYDLLEDLLVPNPRIDHGRCDRSGSSRRCGASAVSFMRPPAGLTRVPVRRRHRACRSDRHRAKPVVFREPKSRRRHVDPRQQVVVQGVRGCGRPCEPRP